MSAASSTPSPASRNLVFQLRLNPLTGDSEWIIVDDGGLDDDEGSPAVAEGSRSLLARTSYLDMLNDSRRNRAFRRAIEKTITGPCHVLDIGAGTGLLSMMAARVMEESEGGREGKVSACESYLPMGKLARRVLRANGMERMVKVFHKRSDDLKIGEDLDSHADVLVSEILDSELLGEGLIPTLQHAHDKLLVKNPRTVPYRATVYGQLVESTFLSKLHDLHNNEGTATDGIRLTPAGLAEIIYVKPQQYAMHCNAISKEIRLLSEPFKIFEFDFWKRPDSYGETEMHIKAIDDGKIHAIVSWWVLQLDCEGSEFYSTAPKWISNSSFNNQNRSSSSSSSASGGDDWCDHWKQCVWFIPGTGMPASKDKHTFLKAVHDDISISYYLRIDNPICYVDFSFTNCHLMLPPEKVALYGDRDWRLALSTAAKNALCRARSSPLCIVADDSIFLTILIASFSKTSNLISFFPGLQEKGAKYLEAVAEANCFSMDHIQVIGKRSSYFISDCCGKRKVNLLVGEPFYYGNEGMLPWQNLRFWKERTMFGSILSEDVIIMPCRGILRASAMSLPDLWNSRCCLKNVEGFDHSVVNETLGACGGLPPSEEGPCLPYFLWQCGEIEELSEAFSIMDFYFSEPIHACHGKRKIEFCKPGWCHGFALWIDWVLDERSSIVLSSGPVSRYWKQGVKLLSKPVEVTGVECSVDIDASFDPSTGDLIVKSSFSSS